MTKKGSKAEKSNGNVKKTDETSDQTTKKDTEMEVNSTSIAVDNVKDETVRIKCLNCAEMLRQRQESNSILKKIFIAMQPLFSDFANCECHTSTEKITKSQNVLKKNLHEGLRSLDELETKQSDMSGILRQLTLAFCEVSAANTRTTKQLSSAKKKVVAVQRLKPDERLYGQENRLLQEIINRKIRENETLRENLVSHQREIKCKESQIRSLKAKISSIIEEWRQKMEKFRKEHLVAYNAAVTNKNLEIQHLKRDQDCLKSRLEREQNRTKRLLKACENKERYLTETSTIVSLQRQINELKEINLKSRRELDFKTKEIETLIIETKLDNDKKTKLNNEKKVRKNRNLHKYQKFYERTKITQEFNHRLAKKRKYLGPKYRDANPEFFSSKLSHEYHLKAKVIYGRKWVIHTIGDSELSKKIYDTLQDYQYRLKKIEDNLPRLKKLVGVLI